MNFRYRLQKVVDLKSNERTQAEWMLSSALGRLQHEESTLSELLETKALLENNLNEASVNSAKISEIMMFQDYITYVDQQIDTKNKDIKIAQTQVTHKKDQLTSKMVDEKVWSKAKEKAFNKYKAFTLKKEQEQLDEMATTQYLIP